MSTKTPQYGEFCWNELMTTDVEKAKEFYSALFGWKTQEHKLGDNKTYTTFSLGEGKDCGLGGMMQIPQGQEKHIPPHWMGYINVADLDATLKKAQSLGASIKMPVTPVSDFGRFAIITDPTGAAIALWESLKSCG